YLEPHRAASDVVVDHAHCLHERVDGRWADERPTALAQVFAHCDRLFRIGQLHELGPVHAPAPWLWLEPPDISREAAELIDQLSKPARVVDRRLDLRPVANDARVAHQPFDVTRRESRDGGRIEAGERGAEVLTLAQDRQPAETGHEAFEADLLEEAAVVGHGPAPLRVVVRAVEVIR